MNFSIQEPRWPSPLLPVETRSYRKQLLFITDDLQESTFSTQMSNENLPFSNLMRHMVVNNPAQFVDDPDYICTPGHLCAHQCLCLDIG